MHSRLADIDLANHRMVAAVLGLRCGYCRSWYHSLGILAGGLSCSFLRCRARNSPRVADDLASAGEEWDDR